MPNVLLLKLHPWFLAWNVPYMLQEKSRECSRTKPISLSFWKETRGVAITHAQTNHRDSSLELVG